ncbi:hypothetical protein FQN55_002621 [Onygenales sp. PD_40]|nr:hypothetical protein FQN55_002621 [Onygenales sp. PD_40]
MKFSTVVLSMATIATHVLAKGMERIETPDAYTFCFDNGWAVDVDVPGPSHILEVTRALCAENAGKEFDVFEESMKVVNYNSAANGKPTKTEIVIQQSFPNPKKLNGDECNNLFKNVIWRCPLAMSGGQLSHFTGGQSRGKGDGHWVAIITEPL